MNLGKVKLPVVLALICVASFVTFLQVEANQETDDPISAAAVWAPDGDALTEIQQRCQSETSVPYSQCFVDQMGSFASSEAVGFTQSLLDQTPARVGYLSGLREAGPVDLGLVAYPGRPGVTPGWALVNGAPAVVNVDDLGRLPQSTMEKDSQFNLLRAKYPKIMLAIENAERTDNLPPMEAQGEGSLRFVITYSLKEPCAACKAVGYARFGFDFDAAGKFLGTKFIGVNPATP